MITEKATTYDLCWIYGEESDGSEMQAERDNYAKQIKELMTSNYGKFISGWE